MDKLDAMAIYVEVVQQRGFSAAARKLGVSAPVVTRAVGELEAALKVRLLIRTTRTVKVTEAGAQYAQDARRLLDEIDTIEQAASGTHQSVSGKLVVSASVMYGRLKVSRVVHEFLRRHPDAEVECRFVDRNLHLLNDGVDVAIRIGELADSSDHATRLATVRRVLVASPDYLARRGTPAQPAELAGHSLVAALGVEPGHEWRFRGSGSEGALSVPVQPRLATTSNEHAILAAAEGLGITRVLSYMVEEPLADGTLVELLPGHAPAPVPVQALQRQGRLASRKVRAFIDLAVAQLRER